MAKTLFDGLEPLTPREKRFVQEYIIDLNGTQAAIRVGYRASSAAVTASELLSKGNVAQAVEEAKAQRAARCAVTADSVLHEMSLLAHSDLSHYVLDETGNVLLADGAPEGAMRAIQSIKRKPVPMFDGTGEARVFLGIGYEVELKLWDKPTPLKLMGKHVSLFPDRMEHTGKDGKPIETLTEIRNVIVKPETPA